MQRNVLLASFDIADGSAFQANTARHYFLGQAGSLARRTYSPPEFEIEAFHSLNIGRFGSDVNRADSQ